MKSFTRKGFLFMVVLLVSFLLVGCGGDSNDGGNGNNNESLLNVDEQLLFDVFTEKVITSYYDPSSVTFITVDGSYCDGSVMVYKTSGKNKLGGVVSTEYCLAVKDIADTKALYSGIDYTGYPNLYTKTLSLGYVAEKELELDQNKYEWTINLLVRTETKDSGKTFSVANLNAELRKYKEAQGWL